MFCAALIFALILPSETMNEPTADFKLVPGSTLTRPFDTARLEAFAVRLREGYGAKAIEFPTDYVELLAIQNGGTPQSRLFRTRGRICIIDRFLHVCPDRTSDQSAEEYCDLWCLWGIHSDRFGPHLIPFATLSGGDFLCFDFRKAADPTIVIVDRRRSQSNKPVTESVADDFAGFCQLVGSCEDKFNVPDFQLQPPTINLPKFDEKVLIEFEHYLDEWYDVKHVRFETQYKSILAGSNGGKPLRCCFKTRSGRERLIEYFCHVMRDPPDDGLRDAHDLCWIWHATYPRIGDHLVPFAELFAGDMLCFDYEKPGRPRIVVWDHEESEDEKPVIEVVANDLDEFAKMVYPRQNN